jgi:hypothetical protein
MKYKLIKTGAEYLLRDINGNTVAITNGTIEGGKLSKQNCDEIFGIIDVEKLADEEVKTFRKGDERLQRWYGFKNGFNKAMDLNKDKLFTFEDMKKAFEKGALFGTTKLGNTHYFDELIQYLQPNEIDVDIEVSWYPKSTYCTSCGSGGKYMETPCDHKNDCEHWSPNFDSEGCLILKKI